MSKIIELPKIDLHCHLDGSISPDIVKKLLVDDSELKNYTDLKEQLQAPKSCDNLTEYLKRFDLPLKCLQTEYGLKTTTYSLIKECAKENIKYIEIRFAPMLCVNDNLSCKKVLESVVEGAKRGEKEFGVFSSVIVCAMRHHSEETNLSMLKIAREFFNQGVCGVDLAGDESHFATQNFKSIFKQVKDYGMPFTIHAGECGSFESIAEAISFGAKRIGHGIAARKSEAVMQLCKDKHIGIEMCPTSNLQTKAVKSLDDYPINLFLEHDLLITVNTDNRTVSNTTLTKELELVYSLFPDSPDIYKKIYTNAVEVAFADDNVKDNLLKLYK